MVNFKMTQTVSGSCSKAAISGSKYVQLQHFFCFSAGILASSEPALMRDDSCRGSGLGAIAWRRGLCLSRHQIVCIARPDRAAAQKVGVEPVETGYRLQAIRFFRCGAGCGCQNMAHILVQGSGR